MEKIMSTRYFQFFNLIILKDKNTKIILIEKCHGLVIFQYFRYFQTQAV